MGVVKKGYHATKHTAHKILYNTSIVYRVGYNKYAKHKKKKQQKKLRKREHQYHRGRRA